MYQGPSNSNRESPSLSSTVKDYIEVPEPPIISLLTDSPYHPKSEESITVERKSSEKKRRVKMADLRNLLETRILSKSDRGLEKVGIGNGNSKKMTNGVN
jgi:hypothetical protein